MKTRYVIVLVLVVLVFGSVNTVWAVTSNVAKIVFTTDPRSVDPNVLSEGLTVQAQNASGEEEKLDGTADVTFISSSATGEFLGSTGKAITRTMNSGSANKTFYYKDSAVGTYVITVQVVPRTGGDGWTAQQTIYVGVEASGSGDDQETEHDESDDVGIGTNVESSSSDSSHSGTAKTSTFSKSPSLKIGAGRNRTVLVNTPIAFEAEHNQAGKKVSPRLDYKWSFGDGDSEVGERVRHVYYFPGEYNVILTARYRNEVATSRIKVKVIDNAIIVASSSPGQFGFVELKNISSSEVNVNGWEIISNDREYVVSVDTIINAKSSIRIPNRVMKFEPDTIVKLKFPTEEVAYVYDKNKELAKEAEQRVYNTLALAAKPIVSHEPIVQEAKVNTIVTGTEDIKPIVNEVKVNYATTVQGAAVAESEDSWWSYIKSFFSIE